MNLLESNLNDFQELDCEHLITDSDDMEDDDE